MLISLGPNILYTVPGTHTLIQHEGPGDASFTLRGGKDGVYLIDIPSDSGVRWFVTAVGA